MADFLNNPIHETYSLQSFPLQLIPINNGVLLKRGAREFIISGNGAEAIIGSILKYTGRKGGTTLQDILNSHEYTDKNVVTDLINKLIARGFLSTDASIQTPRTNEESHLDIFYWHFGKNEVDVTHELNQRIYFLLGVNYITRQIASNFLESGLTNFQIIDHPSLRNLRLFSEKGQVIDENFAIAIKKYSGSFNSWEGDATTHKTVIAASDIGFHPILSEINQFCIEKNWHFFPLVLKNMRGYIGPLVIPRETACFECFRKRQDSNLDNPTTKRISENFSFQGQHVIGFHPSMPSIIGNIAALEVTKFYLGAIPDKNVSVLLDVNLLSSKITSRKVLKLPRCSACSNLYIIAPSSKIIL